MHVIMSIILEDRDSLWHPSYFATRINRILLSRGRMYNNNNNNILFV